MSKSWRVIVTMTLILVMGFAALSSKSMYGKFSDDPDSIAYKVNKEREKADNIINNMFKNFGPLD